MRRRALARAGGSRSARAARGFSGLADWLAERAVQREPVSPPQFPDLREKTDRRRSAPFTIAETTDHDGAKQAFTISEMRTNHPSALFLWALEISHNRCPASRFMPILPLDYPDPLAATLGCDTWMRFRQNRVFGMDSRSVSDVDEWTKPCLGACEPSGPLSGVPGS